MKDTNVPVEKLALWIDDWYGGDGEPGEKLKEKLSQAIQAAKEERDVELLEKIIEMKDKQYEDRQILSVIQGELSIGSIINKHQ